MANISLIYDGLITLIETKLPTYSRLADAYDIDNNDILSIVSGYSLALSSGTNTERYITGSSLSTDRGFSLTLTNLYTANETDPVGRAVQEKSLLEDAYSIWKELQVTHALGGVQVSPIKYTDDTGINYIESETYNGKAISIVSAISAEYFE